MQTGKALSSWNVPWSVAIGEVIGSIKTDLMDSIGPKGLQNDRSVEADAFILSTTTTYLFTKQISRK